MSDNIPSHSTWFDCSSEEVAEYRELRDLRAKSISATFLSVVVLALLTERLPVTINGTEIPEIAALLILVFPLVPFYTLSQSINQFPVEARDLVFYELAKLSTAADNNNWERVEDQLRVIEDEMANAGKYFSQPESDAVTKYLRLIDSSDVNTEELESHLRQFIRDIHETEKYKRSISHETETAQAKEETDDEPKISSTEVLAKSLNTLPGSLSVWSGVFVITLGLGGYVTGQNGLYSLALVLAGGAPIILKNWD